MLKSSGVEKLLPTFAEFMERSLYGPQGYYSSGIARSGREGDYFTAPDVSPVFGRLLATLFSHWAEEFAVKPFHLVEMGAGEGALAKSIAASLPQTLHRREGDLAYILVERSEARRKILERGAGELYHPHKILPSLKPLKGQALTGCFFANELLDAFPVHRVRMHQGKLQEAFVAETLAGADRWVWGEPKTQALSDYFRRLGIQLPENYETEINLAMRAWVQEVGAALQSGLVVIIDYGRPAHAYYDPARSRGTLRGFRRHEVRRDVLAEGIMDMTADVDFTSLALDAQDAGFAPLAFMEMGSFLSMIARLFVDKNEVRETAADPSDWAGFRYLVHPEGLGSSFHVLILGKGIDPADWPFEGNRLARLGLPR